MCSIKNMNKKKTTKKHPRYFFCTYLQLQNSNEKSNNNDNYALTIIWQSCRTKLKYVEERYWNFVKFTGKHLCQSLFFMRIQWFKIFIGLFFRSSIILQFMRHSDIFHVHIIFTPFPCTKNNNKSWTSYPQK